MSGPDAALILIAAGGTGGHVYPALAIALALREEGYEVQWVGTRQGIEYRLVSEAQIPLHILPARGLRGKAVLDKIAGTVTLGWSLLRAIWLVLRLGPQCVVGMGGYASGPTGVAAWLLRVPLLIHEQNAVAGTTNRLLAPLARVVYCGFEGAFGDRRNARAVGNPVRTALLEQAQSSPWDYRGNRPLRLLVLGGSLGALAINRIVPPTLRQLRETGHATAIEVHHQSGMNHLQECLQDYGELIGDGVRVEPYIEDMAAAYAWADLVLCRAGALTVAEVATMGLPSLLIPLPHAIDDHQTANALHLTRRGAGLLLQQDNLDVDLLSNTLINCSADPQRLSAMSKAARDLANPAATREIVQGIGEVLNRA